MFCRWSRAALCLRGIGCLPLCELTRMNSGLIICYLYKTLIAVACINLLVSYLMSDIDQKYFCHARQRSALNFPDPRLSTRNCMISVKMLLFLKKIIVTKICLTNQCTVGRGNALWPRISGGGQFVFRPRHRLSFLMLCMGF
jgi:hypothetical protein